MNDELPLYLSREQEKYIEIGYQLIDVDYLKEEYKYEWIKARNCSRELDFGANNATRAYFDNFAAGYSLMCPDVKNDTHLVLKGVHSTPI